LCEEEEEKRKRSGKIEEGEPYTRHSGPSAIHTLRQPPAHSINSSAEKYKRKWF